MCERNRIVVLLLLAGLLPCNGVSLLQQLEHIARRRLENRQGINMFTSGRKSFYNYDPKEASNILGVPEHPSHLPEAEPILPGHTLIRPSIGMLKSSVRFPHVDLEDGSGIYGNIENLGIKYDGVNERVLYTGFRRTPSDYIMIPEKNTVYKSKPSFWLLSTVLDSRNKNSINRLLSQLQKLNLSRNDNIIILTALLGDNPYTSLFQNSYLYGGVKSIRDNRTWKWNKSPTSSTHHQRSLSEQEDNELVENSVTKEDVSKQKLISLLKAKNEFNRIKFSDSAPDFDTFIPARITKTLRDWWFFNQDDYKTLTEM